MAARPKSGITSHLKSGVQPLVLAVFIAVPIAAQAQLGGGGDFGGGNFGGGNIGGDIGSIGAQIESGARQALGAAAKNPYAVIAMAEISRAATGSITGAIGDSYDFCSGQVPDQYVVDCLGDQLETIAGSMANTGEYREARRILRDTGRKMRKLAKANRAAGAPRARVQGKVKGRKLVSRPLTAVAAPRIKSVKRQAAVLLEEAETQLLRSAQSSDRRLIAYAQMSKAIGSTKKLLRSA